MNKDDLIDILIDWVEEDKKLDTDIGHFIDIEDITSICGGGWIGLGDKRYSPHKWVRRDKYIKIKENIIKNGWGKSYSPCILSFLKPKRRSKKGWISDIIIKDGNHRIVMLDRFKIKKKVYTKFIFDGPMGTRLGSPHRKKIQYEIQKG